MPISPILSQRLLFVFFGIGMLALSVVNYYENKTLHEQLEILTKNQELLQLQQENALLKAEANAAHEAHIKRLLAAGIARP